MRNNKLDRIDLKILKVLQTNGRVTNVELARSVALSASACLDRVKRLEEQGVIMGYGAYLNVDKLGSNITVYVEITLKNHHRQDFEHFEKVVLQMPEILDCHQVSGGFDYVVKFLCANTEAFQTSMNNLLAVEPNIHTYFSYIALKRIKLSSKEIPLQSLMGDQPG